MTELKRVPNTDIIYKSWVNNENKAVFILIHGLGAHADRWKFLAEYFLNQNISSYALALKGFADMGNTKPHIQSFRIYHNDILNLRDQVKKMHPGRKIFLVGESMGGNIAFNLAAENPGLFDGLICISPAFANAIRFSFGQYLELIYGLIFEPDKQIFLPFTVEQCTQDTDYQKVMKNNPQELRTASAKLLLNILLEQLHSSSLVKKLTTPVLFLLSLKDTMVNPQASKNIFNKIEIEDKKLIGYEDMRHALSIEKERDWVFQDLAKWVNGRI